MCSQAKTLVFILSRLASHVVKTCDDAVAKACLAFTYNTVLPANFHPRTGLPTVVHFEPI